MISKPKVTAVIVLSVLMGLVFSPAFADRYRPAPEGANPESEALEAPAAKENLIDSSYNTVTGAAYITGKTITGTANAGGKALVGTAEAGVRTLGDAADASGKALVGTAEAGGRMLGGAADAITGTAGAAYRTVVGGEEPVEEVQIEEVAIEQPTEKNLFEASWDTLTGTADAIGRTFSAVYSSVFPVKEPEVEPEEPQTRMHRFVPRFHGMVARQIGYRQR